MPRSVIDISAITGNFRVHLRQFSAMGKSSSLVFPSSNFTIRPLSPTFSFTIFAGSTSLIFLMSRPALGIIPLSSMAITNKLSRLICLILANSMMALVSQGRAIRPIFSFFAPSIDLCKYFAAESVLAYP